MDIAIYGCGKLGNYVMEQLIENGKQSGSIALILLIDNYCEKDVIHDLPVVSVETFTKDTIKKHPDINVIIAIKDYHIAQKEGIGLRAKGISVLFLHPQMYDAKLPVISDDGSLSQFVTCFEDTMPVLPYLEYQVADQCNLNCKACMHFSNIVKTAKFPSIEDFSDSLSAIMKKFRSIQTLRLMGGEPLLNDELDRFIVAARMIAPDADIRVVTNGLLVTEMTTELIATIKQNHAILDISQYPPIRKRLNEIIRFLDDHGIVYIIGEPISEFMVRLSDGSTDPEDVFYGNCLSNMCTFLRNVRLYVCPHIPLLYEQQDFFNINISEDELISNSIDILDDSISGWDILNRIEIPFSLCRYCSRKPERIIWENGQANSEEWKTV